MRFLSASRMFTGAIKRFFQLVLVEKFSFIFKNHSPLDIGCSLSLGFLIWTSSYYCGFYVPTPLESWMANNEQGKTSAIKPKWWWMNGEKLFKVVFTRYTSTSACVVHDTVKMTIAKRSLHSLALKSSLYCSEKSQNSWCETHRLRESINSLKTKHKELLKPCKF